MTNPIYEAAMDEDDGIITTLFELMVAWQSEHPGATDEEAFEAVCCTKSHEERHEQH